MDQRGYFTIFQEAIRFYPWLITPSDSRAFHNPKCERGMSPSLTFRITFSSRTLERFARHDLVDDRSKSVVIGSDAGEDFFDSGAIRKPNLPAECIAHQ